MQKVRVTGPKLFLREVIQALHTAKLMHLISYEKKDQDYFNIGSPFSEATDYSNAVIETRSLIDFFKIKGTGKTINIENAAGKIHTLHKEFQNTLKIQKEIKDTIKELEGKNTNQFFETEINQKIITQYKNLDIFLGTIQKPLDKKQIEKSTAKFELIEKTIDKKNWIALFADKKSKENIQTLLREHGFSEVKYVHIDFKQIEKELNTAKKQLEETEHTLKQIENEKQWLLDIEYTLSQEIEKAEVPLHFATSKNSFIIHGWIPAKQLTEFKKKLNTKTMEKIYFEEFKDTENAPVQLNNPKAISPFEFFLNLYTLPKYYELDPSALMAFTFPFFFGFMLGDVGYGVIALILFQIVKRKFKDLQVQAIANILTLASIASIIFGFVFGEVFGEEFIEHPLLNRVHDINTMLLVTIAVGIIHLNLGFILGFYNKLKHHGFKHALLEKGSWIIIEIGIATALLANQTVGAIIAVIGLIMLYKGEGFRGMIELPALLSNILSYARLFAIGLASVQLALIVNMLAGQALGLGIIGYVLAAFVILIGHGLNLFLGLLGPFIQSLRLHYVEWFSKFFEGGGEPYKPFGIKEKA